MTTSDAEPARGLGRDSPIPYYSQIADILRDDIEMDRMTPGSRLPSEAALATRFGVSRMTARKAVQQLTTKGYVYRRERSGTFVGQPRLAHAVSTESSFSLAMTAAGHEVTTVVLSAAIGPASEPSASILDIGEGAGMVDIRRLRFVDGEPVAIHETRLPSRFAAVLGFDLTGSLAEILRGVGAGSERASDAIEVIEADSASARLLHIPGGSPLMRVEGIGYGRDGRPVRHTISLFRGDRFRFSLSDGRAPFDIQLMPAT